jgi:hypothetical protein
VFSGCSAFYKDEAISIVASYAKRMVIENTLSDAVLFFYTDALSIPRSLNCSFNYRGEKPADMPILLAAKFEPTLNLKAANDNAGRTHPSSSTSYSNHWSTPASVLVDALGRNMAIVKRNGSWPALDWFTTQSTSDIRGNLLTVVDPLGRTAFSYTYDLLNRALRVESPLDAGTKRRALDAGGNVLERRDSKGALVLNAYDPLNRPIRMWARDGVGQPMSLRERLIYGDSPDSGLADAADLNLLGRLYRHYDEAGQLALASLEEPPAQRLDRPTEQLAHRRDQAPPTRCLGHSACGGDVMRPSGGKAPAGTAAEIAW